SVCPLTLGVPITVLLYISCPYHFATLHQVFPSGVPPYTQSTPFYHISPSECPFTSYSPSEWPFPSHVPIRVHLSTVCAHLCPLNIKCAHQSAP
ncbi:unnamed protein product, partial [Staurois parvus]